MTGGENMKNDSYETIINTLRKTQPEAKSHEELTKSILANIEKIHLKQYSGIIVNASEKQWIVFSNFRTIMAAAAIFLIGFFIYQHYELTDKINRIENEFITSKQSPDLENYSYFRNTNIQKLIENPELVNNIKLLRNTSNSDFVMINKKSLDYLLNVINELEKENTGIREKLLKYYSDSIINKTK